MTRLTRLVPVLGVNSVPVLGVFAAGWPWGAALVLYWFENLLGSFLVAVRIALHRRWTRKRGHWLASATEPVPKKPVQATFLAGFLTPALVFTLGHGLFLAIILSQLFPATQDGQVLRPSALLPGAAAIAVFLLLGLAYDLVGLRRRPFAWLAQLTRRMLGRIVVVHLVIVFGMAATVWLGGPIGILAVFAVLKTLTDLGSVLPDKEAPDEAPRWLTAVVNRIGPADGYDRDFAVHYRKERERERRLQAEYEEVRA